MKLKDIKKSLSKFPRDMDDMEILIQYTKENTTQYENLCFVGYLPLPENECIILGTTSAAIKLSDEGKIKLPPEPNL